MLTQFGNSVICLDSTHGTNEYKFELTTLLVIDENNKGFPCRFMLSNIVSEITLNIFFEKIKDKIGI